MSQTEAHRVVRVKAELVHITHHKDGVKDIAFRPVVSGSKENAQFFKYTPSGDFKFTTVNAEAVDHLVVGREYFFDIHEAPPAA